MNILILKSSVTELESTLRLRSKQLHKANFSDKHRKNILEHSTKILQGNGCKKGSAVTAG